MGLVGYRLIARVALAGPAIVDQPDQGVQHIDVFPGQSTVVPALLGPVLQGARPVHDSDLGLPVEGNPRTIAKDLLTARA